MTKTLRCAPALVAALGLTAACGDGEMIAPGCAESFCAEVEVSAALSCYDPIAEQSFSMSLGLSGLTREVSCGVFDGDGGRDLMLYFAQEDAPEGAVDYVSLRLRDYTGPGTYDLHNLSEEEEGDHLGLKLVGLTSRPPGMGNRDQIVGTVECQSGGCQAIVAPGSELIPDDPYTTLPFRVRVEVICAAGATLHNFSCDETATTCDFVEAPVMRFDVACRH